MIRYIARRLVFATVVVVGVLVITFLIVRVLPGDPARLYAGGPRATPDQVDRARHELGLDRPLVEQLGAYMGNVVRGDFGRSFVTRRTVVEDLARFFPATLELVIPVMSLALMLGVPVGVVSGARSGGRIDQTTRFLAISGAALPPFWLALVAQLVFASSLGWLPVAGRLGSEVTVLEPIDRVTGFYTVDAVLAGNWIGLGDALAHLVLPIVVLSVYPISLVIRQTRSSVVEVMREPFVTAARASGLPERTIMFRFVLKNAFVPTLTVLGLTFVASLTGSVLIEVIFGWPGIGRYVTDSIIASDLPAVVAVTVIGTVGYVVVNLVVDLIQAALDPRVRAR